MKPHLWGLDLSNKFYPKNLNFYQNGGHFGRHLGFGGVRNKFFEVDLLNIVCYAISLKISMVYLVCTDGETKPPFSVFGPPLIMVKMSFDMGDGCSQIDRGSDRPRVR